MCFPRWIRILALLAVTTGAYHADWIIETSKQAMQEAHAACLLPSVKRLFLRQRKSAPRDECQVGAMNYCKGCKVWAHCGAAEDGREYGYIKKKAAN